MIPTLAHFSFIQPGEWGQYTDDIRQLFVELADHRPQGQAAPAGTCRPSVDVFETDEAIATGNAVFNELRRSGCLVARCPDQPAPSN